MKIVIATTNRGKYREIKAFLEKELPEGIELLSLADFSPLPKVEENAKTIRGNALKKALTYAKSLGLPVVAEDSALEVDALGGRPGVFSARYGKNDEERVRRVLKELISVPPKERTARFRCVMVLALPAGEKYLSQGVVEGVIVEAPRGKGGFGYDPIFLYPPFGKTFAEVSPQEKLSVSHRGKALRGILKFLKFLYLGKRLSFLKRVAVAFSGGVDSSFLAFCAKKFTDEPVLFFAETPLISEDAIIHAERIAEFLDMKLEKFSLDLLKVDGVRDNAESRCYYCKRAIYEVFAKRAEERSLTLLDGTNFSDIDEERPGLKALKELGVLSPLRTAGLSKSEIRALAKVFQLPFWDKPSNTCLATRVRFGIPLTPSLLNRIEHAEAYLKLLGFRVIRVRVDSPEICRIEVGKDELKKIFDKRIMGEVLSEFKKIGFKRVSLDLEGYDV